MAKNDNVAYSKLRMKRSYKRLHISRETQEAIAKIEKQIATCNDAMAKIAAKAKVNNEDPEDDDDYKKNKAEGENLLREERLRKYRNKIHQKIMKHIRRYSYKYAVTNRTDADPKVWRALLLEIANYKYWPIFTFRRLVNPAHPTHYGALHALDSVVRTALDVNKKEWDLPTHKIDSQNYPILPPKIDDGKKDENFHLIVFVS